MGNRNSSNFGKTTSIIKVEGQNVRYGYYKNNKKVFYDGISLNLRKSEVKSFKKLKYSYAKTNNLVFYKGEIIPDIVPENFNKSNILDKINNIYKNKIIYGSESIDNNKIITSVSANLFNNSDIDKLRDITKDYKIYYWWSDLPIYKRTHLTHFFDIIKYDNIVFHHFDHLIYLNYLILYHDFTILNLTHILHNDWSLEEYNTDDISNLIILKNYKFGFSWMTLTLFNKFKQFLIDEGTFMIYHLDRDEKYSHQKVNYVDKQKI